MREAQERVEALLEKIPELVQAGGASRLGSRCLQCREREGSVMPRVDVNIMGQAYSMVCRDGEERALREAAIYLDSKMKAIRDAAGQGQQ
jgi:cell division protein ZapA (FtsZ GTPase activity inhibitor)